MVWPLSAFSWGLGPWAGFGGVGSFTGFYLCFGSMRRLLLVVVQAGERKIVSVAMERAALRFFFWLIAGRRDLVRVSNG